MHGYAPIGAFIKSSPYKMLLHSCFSMTNLINHRRTRNINKKRPEEEMIFNPIILPINFVIKVLSHSRYKPIAYSVLFSIFVFSSGLVCHVTRRGIHYYNEGRGGLLGKPTGN